MKDSTKDDSIKLIRAKEILSDLLTLLKADADQLLLIREISGQDMTGVDMDLTRILDSAGKNLLRALNKPIYKLDPITEPAYPPATSVHFHREFLIANTRDGVRVCSPFVPRPPKLIPTIITKGYIKTVCSDVTDSTVYLVTTKNKGIHYDLKNLKQISEWDTPEVGSCHGQILMSFDGQAGVHLADPQNHSILTFKRNGEYSQTMVLEDVKWTTFIAYYDDCIIASGDGHLAMYSMSDSMVVWILELEGVAGVCTTKDGMIYAGVNKQRCILAITENGKVAACQGHRVGH